MSINPIAKRYARALLKICNQDAAQGRQLLNSLGPFLDLFAVEDARRVLVNPIMPLDLKKSLISYAAEKSQAGKSLRAFLDVVMEGGRIALLPEIIAAFEDILNEKEGIVNAKITAAADLNNTDLESVKGILESAWSKTVELTPAVDKDLLGGFVVNVGHSVVDLSVRKKLNQLAKTAVES